MPDADTEAMKAHGFASLLFGERPWFQGHRRVAVAVAASLFLAVLVVSLAVSNAEAIVVLYALPVALLAVAFGRRGGVVGAAVAMILSAVSISSPLDWATGAIAVVLLGFLLGDATDRIMADQRRARREALDHERLEEERRRHREALELHDSVVQGIAAGIWMLDVGSNERALDALTSTMGVAQHLVSELLGGAPVEPGALAGSNGSAH